MSIEPQVSVVMSVFNDGRYLRGSVESILHQQGVHFEFIVVDDGSTDESGSILEEYASRDGRIRLFRRENQGLTKSLIFACRQARAPFIARQDADDISLPGRLGRLRDLVVSDDRLVLVSSWVRYIGPDDEPLQLVQRPEDCQRATHQLLHERQGPPAHGSVLFCRSAFEQAGGYREAFYYGQDADLWLRLCTLGLAGYVQDCLYEYRYAAEGISVARRDLQSRFGQLGQRCHQARLNGRSEVAWLTEAEALRQQIESGQQAALAAPRAQARASYFLGASLQANGYASARKYLWQAVRGNPAHWRAWVRLFRSYMPGSSA